MTATPAATAPSGADIRRLVLGTHTDPHTILGVHPRGAGSTVIRAFQPRATAVEVAFAAPAGVRVIPMTKLDSAGLWEALLDVTEPAGYRLRMTGDQHTWETDDPYRFLPTLGELDLHLIGEGAHKRLWDKLGAHVVQHQGVTGTAFAVWAPNARGVSVVSDSNGWDDRTQPMRLLGESGVWELFIPGIGEGVRYKFRVIRSDGSIILKADPLARAAEVPPDTASIVSVSHHEWHDAAWISARAESDLRVRPVNIYEVHLGSWRRGDGDALLTYREAAQQLAEYCVRMGFTHVELLPLAEHPFGGSWGYQVSSYFAPTSRYGSPDDLRWFIDHLHSHNIGVILDWVPAHFPRDEWALARFDGTALYEHADPRKGSQPDWGTLVFNYARNEVRNFLIANARYWVEEFHVDGLRVDAVASMLYLDYSRGPGQWVPNQLGGRENLEAISLLRAVNDEVRHDYPGAVTIAEESTSWPGVTRSTESGGLGFTLKWNMGWMHDTLDYLSKDPVFRRYHHQQLTFAIWYAWSENFVLPLSHDEVVHLKHSLLGRMPGDDWQKFANLRALYGWMWAHPGKKLLFMGGDIAQWREWNHDRSLDWHLLEEPRHVGMQKLLGDLGRAYVATPALWEQDAASAGFRWVDSGNVDQNVASFVRWDTADNPLVCVANFSPHVYEGFRLGLPRAGRWREVVNTDAGDYGGSGVGNMGEVQTEPVHWNADPQSALITVPPLGVLWLVPVA